jgi:hypothetical protein
VRTVESHGGPGEVDAEHHVRQIRDLFHDFDHPEAAHDA